VLEVATSFLFVIWAVGEFFAGNFRVVPNPLYVPMTLFAGVVVLQVVLHRTAYWYATWSGAILWGSYAILFFLVANIFGRREWLPAFGCFCIAFGFLLSLFAVVQQFTSNGKIYWVVTNRYGGWIYGPYVNHAHYAGLMEMLVPFPIIFAILRPNRLERATFLFAAVVMGSTIFLSLSLGGMISFAAEMAVLSLVLIRTRRFARGEILLLVLLCLALIGWLAWLRPTGLIERLARLSNPIRDAGATGRIAILRDSLRMLRERPILGWGLRTFPVVYPSFRSFFTNQWVNEAHNDYVQTIVETGIAGFSAAIAFLVLLCNEGIHNLRRWRSNNQYAFGLAAFLGCVGLMVHSLVDFNLQIPANAAFFFSLSALVTSRPKKPGRAHLPPWPQGWQE